MNLIDLSVGNNENGPESIPHLISWIHEAGNPYFDWFFGGANSARSELERWIMRPSSEIYFKKAMLLQAGGEVIGGMIGMAGAQLRSCRRADTLALIRDRTPDQQEVAVSRMKKSSGLFGAPSEDEYYLSKMGLVPDARGKGCGRILVQAHLDKGLAAGYRKFVLDVSATNRPAVKLYEAFGFRTISEASDVCGQMTYRFMKLELGRI